MVGELSTRTQTREEALVHVAGHGLRHLWQTTHTGKRGKVWGARGQYSDRDADAYAIRKTREWRKIHATDIYVEQPDQIPIVQKTNTELVQCMTVNTQRGCNQ
jgi:hypothetical protein